MRISKIPEKFGNAFGISFDRLVDNYGKHISVILIVFSAIGVFIDGYGGIKQSIGNLSFNIGEFVFGIMIILGSLVTVMLISQIDDGDD